ncbi:hypothetical protein TPL01_15060 [Sulfuriferula plumbiphila]|uniref:Uncharacterized protein n=1 Tax=Sulfuriferula plumbiphila TaxID=171865 RepID=A0A512L7A7_9PROT|nr:hypothetical protein SFPGR_27530 [Sulfuriferula plumbiphila]GEP30368.1 hypothetical protein TPL01_15060 [Sulfuriferula plumbiphila]
MKDAREMQRALPSNVTHSPMTGPRCITIVIICAMFVMTGIMTAWSIVTTGTLANTGSTWVQKNRTLVRFFMIKSLNVFQSERISPPT